MRNGVLHSLSLFETREIGLGIALIQGFGTYSFQVKDAQQFITQIVGAQGIYRTSEIESRMKAILLSKLQDLLGETTGKKSVLDLIGPDRRSWCPEFAQKHRMILMRSV